MGKNNNLYWIWYSIIFLVIVIIMVFFSISERLVFLKIDKPVACYDIKHFNETLETINKNCDSMFITTKWGTENKLFVFKGTLDDPYIPIEECLE